MAFSKPQEKNFGLLEGQAESSRLDTKATTHKVKRTFNFIKRNCCFAKGLIKKTKEKSQSENIYKPLSLSKDSYLCI